MPKLVGVFSAFKDLEKLKAEDLNQWLKVKENPYYLENFIGNRILYPQVVPISIRELEIDLAILREYIKLHPESVYNSRTKKLILEEELEIRFPPFAKLIAVILDVLDLEGPTSVLVKRLSGTLEIVGTIIAFTPSNQGFTEVKINGQVLALETSTVTILPNQEKAVMVQLDDSTALSVAGGSLGIVIDLRKVK